MSTTHSITKKTYKQLTAIERGKIAAYHSEGKRAAEIARLIGRHRSTIIREINRGSVDQKQEKNGKEIYYKAYFPETAQLLADKRKKNSYYLKLPKVSKTFLEEFTAAMKIKYRLHSVDSFYHTYKEEHPTEVILSTKTLYTYIHQGLLEVKPIDLPKAVRVRKRKKTRSSTKKQLGKSIEERPDRINTREEFGHWEIDSVLGKKTKNEPSILTLVERQTRYALTVKLDGKKADYVQEAVRKLRKEYPIKSITADNGSEFASLSDLEGLEVYFAHPYSSHERGSNEHFNGLLREYIPKGGSLCDLKKEKLAFYTDLINSRPRRIHHYQTAKNLFGLAQTD